MKSNLLLPTEFLLRKKAKKEWEKESGGEALFRGRHFEALDFERELKIGRKKNL